MAELRIEFMYSILVSFSCTDVHLHQLHLQRSVYFVFILKMCFYLITICTSVMVSIVVMCFQLKWFGLVLIWRTCHLPKHNHNCNSLLIMVWLEMICLYFGGDCDGKTNNDLYMLETCKFFSFNHLFVFIPWFFFIEYAIQPFCIFFAHVTHKHLDYTHC